MQELSVLETYILVCLSRGMETGYDLLRSAGLSIGATNPALRRLLKAGYVARAVGETKSARPKFAFKLTSKGTREAQSGWQRYLERPDTDLDVEAVLRIVDMAGLGGADAKKVGNFLLKASELRSEGAKRLMMEADLQAYRKRFEYPYLKLRLEGARLESEARALADLANSVNPRAKRRAKSPTQYIQQTFSGLAQKGR